MNENGLHLEETLNYSQMKLDRNEHLTFNDVHIKPTYSEVKSRSNCDTTSRISKNRYIDLPFIASPMDTICEEDMAFEMWRLGGIGFIHRFDSIEKQAERVKIVDDKITSYRRYAKNEGAWDLSDDEIEDIIGREVVVGGVIGVTDNYYQRANALIEAGANVILIDVAHGHHKFLENAIYKLKSSFPSIDFIGGSIATREAAIDLIDWGVDGLRVGIGNGSMCETRIRAGVGVPQISALLEIIPYADQVDIPVIADGGIKTPGDMCKAIATGADTVMLGSVLSGTKETPGSISRRGMWPNERLYKSYRGSASFQSKKDRGEETRNVEGNSRVVEYKGKVERIVKGLREGLQSSMSYVGAHDIQEFHNNAKLVKVSSAGHVEGTPHGME